MKITSVFKTMGMLISMYINMFMYVRIFVYCLFKCSNLLLIEGDIIKNNICFQDNEDGYILSPRGSSFYGKVGPNLKLCGEVSRGCYGNCWSTVGKSSYIRTYAQTYVRTYIYSNQ